MKKIKSIIAVMALTLTAFLVSCSSETFKELASSIGGGGKSNVVTFQLESGNKSMTRAEGEDYDTGVPLGSIAGFDRENAINFDKLYVVVFKLNADGQTYSWYKTFKKDGTNGTAITKTAGATVADDRYQFVMGDGGVYYMYVIANAETDLTTLDIPALATAGGISEREAFYRQLENLDKSAYVAGGTSKLNEVTDLLMTSNQIQVNIKGDEETELPTITLTRAIARIDIDASAMPDNFRIDKVKFENRHNNTYLIRGALAEDMTDVNLTKDYDDGATNTPKEYARANVKIDVTPASPGPPATPATSNYEGTMDNIWNGVIYSCENYDTSDGNRTVLTVEGTYTSGDREGITVSHEIDFGTMQIKRNYLYKVRIALEDPAGDTYGKVTHAINVKDWTSGVTLAWAGDENLYNNSQAASFVITNAMKITDDDAVSQRFCIKRYDATMSSKFYVESTSTKSGLSLTCPATALPATAAEIAANSEAGDYQCKITPMESTYYENGQFTQKWEVTVRMSALSNGNVLNFYIRNALNAEQSLRFEVTNPYEGIAIGDIIYEDGSWTHDVADVATKMSAGHTPVAIVFATKDEITIPDYDKAKGFTHGYAMALKENQIRYLWANPAVTSFMGTGITHDDAMNLTMFNAARRDYNGLEHCDDIQSKIDDGTYALSRFPAYQRAKTYTAVTGETVSDYASDWFLPSIGQAYRWYVEFGGKVDNDSYSLVRISNNNNNRICYYWSNGGATYGTAINNYLTGKVGTGNFTPFVYGNAAEPGWYTTSTEYYFPTKSVYTCMILDFSWSNGNAGGNSNGHLSADYVTTKTYRVRPIIAL